MGTKNNPGKFDCYAKAEPDEPMFVLLARDPLAAALVRRWACRAEQEAMQSGEKVEEALLCADQMEAWARARWLEQVARNRSEDAEESE